jgi:LysM repeat protein
MATTTASPPKTAYQKWQDTVAGGKTDTRWAGYDAKIKLVVADFNTRLGSTTGYKPLDWRLVKAMVWVESGGPDNAAWKLRPMQIGNPGDAGLAALLSDKEGGEIILTPEMKKRLTTGSSGEANIEAGTAYLLMRAASYATKSVPDATDTQIREVIVHAGDSLDKIARANTSTVEMLVSLNPGATGIIKPGQKLKVRKAALRKLITGWQALTTAFAAKRYNIRDPKYQEKLDYCLGLMPP